MDRKHSSPSVGPKLRSLRQERRLSLRTLASETGFSPSFLSQVELEQVSPSLVSLDRIARCLGVSLAGLLSNPEPPPPGAVLQRKGDAGVRSEWSKASARSLLPAGVGDGIDVVVVIFEPGGHSGVGGPRARAKELAYCVRGRLELRAGDQTLRLSSGDSVLYDLSKPVRWKNTGHRTAEVMLVTFDLASSGEAGSRR